MILEVYASLFFPLRCNGQMLPNSFHSYYYRQCIYCSMNERYLYPIFLSLSSSTDIIRILFFSCLMLILSRGLDISLPAGTLSYPGG